LDDLGHIGGDDEPSELEYAENEEYLTPPQEGDDRLVPIEMPSPELVVYAPDNEGSSSDEGVTLVVEKVRDGEFECQVRHYPG